MALSEQDHNLTFVSLFKTSLYSLPSHNCVIRRSDFEICVNFLREGTSINRVCGSVHPSDVQPQHLIPSVRNVSVMSDKCDILRKALVSVYEHVRLPSCYCFIPNISRERKVETVVAGKKTPSENVMDRAFYLEWSAIQYHCEIFIQGKMNSVSISLFLSRCQTHGRNVRILSEGSLP